MHNTKGIPEHFKFFKNVILTPSGQQLLQAVSLAGMAHGIDACKSYISSLFRFHASRP